MYRNILVILDGSHSAEEALPHAKAVAGRFGSRLFLVSVIEMARVKAHRAAGVDEACDPQLSRELMGRYLDSIAERLEADGMDVQTELLEDEGSAILDYAETHNADLIVVASHNGHDLAAWVQAITEQARVPVLLVPA